MKKLFLLLLAITLATACKEAPKKVNILPTKVAFKQEGTLTIKTADSSFTKALAIEIADNTYERQTGLMYRKSMQNDRGMLFIFNDERPRSFYMKNTYIPLDIIYISANKTIVSIAENTNPLDETSIPSTGPAMYVLEINAGLSKQWGLKAGDSISFKKL